MQDEKEQKPALQSHEEHQSVERNFSRRSVVVGLVGLATAEAIAGGVNWQVVSRWLHKLSLAFAPAVPHTHPTPLPAGVVYIYRKHTLDVYAAVWSPDGQRVFSGSADRTVQVWDATTGGHALTYRGHTGEVNSVSWWSKVRLIASGSTDNTVRVWDSGNGTTETIYKGHTQSVRTVVWAPSGSQIASGGDDKTVQVWDGVTRARVSTYTGHTDVVWAVDWSPDGKYMPHAVGMQQSRCGTQRRGRTFSPTEAIARTYGLSHGHLMAGVLPPEEGIRRYRYGIA
jgi:WD40 repeat protein